MPTSAGRSSNARLPDDALRRRRSRRGLALVAVVLVAAGCSGVPTTTDRTELIRRILGSTVQLRSEREGGVRRAASGVVVATDPSSKRGWIITVRHFLGPSRQQEVWVRLPGQTLETQAVVFAVSDADLGLDIGIVEVEIPGLVPVRLKDSVSNLGDEVLIVAFPWGQRLTVVRGIVSQLLLDPSSSLVSGPARMVDAPVSYGSSGGGVFDARSGELIGIVETYRTAKITIPDVTMERVLEIPVPGETVLVPASVIRSFVQDFGLARRLP